MRVHLTAEMQERSVAFCEWLEANFPVDPMDAGFITFRAQETFLPTAKQRPRASVVVTIPKNRQTAS
jgi:hypothetical protein